MPRYLAKQTRELFITAPNASVARAMAEQGFNRRTGEKVVLPKELSMSEIQNSVIKVEKV